jgi:hypothetical protein
MLRTAYFLIVISMFGWLRGLDPVQQSAELVRRIRGISAHDNITHTDPSAWVGLLFENDIMIQARMQAAQAQAQPHLVCEIHPPNSFFDTKSMDCGP